MVSTFCENYPDGSWALLVSFGENFKYYAILLLKFFRLYHRVFRCTNFIKTWIPTFLNKALTFLANSSPSSATTSKNKRYIHHGQDFISSNHEGSTAVLGRGGSDYSASIFGATLSSKVNEIRTAASTVSWAPIQKRYPCHNSSTYLAIGSFWE